MLRNKIFSPKVRLQLLEKVNPNQAESIKHSKQEESENINSYQVIPSKLIISEFSPFS